MLSIYFSGCVDIWEPKVLRSAAGAHFRLPIHNAIDWEDMPKYLEERTSIFIADSDAKITEDGGVGDKFYALRIPVLPYYGVQYSTMHHITLVIGGETEGISEDSYRQVFLLYIFISVHIFCIYLAKPFLHLTVLKTTQILGSIQNLFHINYN